MARAVEGRGKILLFLSLSYLLDSLFDTTLKFPGEL